MEENVLLTQSKQFAIQIINLCDNLIANFSLINQLVRSGTSIGANIREAQYAQSKLDFINKFEIALKECYETEYWLELLYETKKLDENIFLKLRNNAGAIRKMLISSIKRTKERIQQ